MSSEKELMEPKQQHKAADENSFRDDFASKTKADISNSQKDLKLNTHPESKSGMQMDKTWDNLEETQNNVLQNDSTKA